MRKKRCFSLAVIFLVVSALSALTGCGYEIIREKGIYGGEISSLSVPVFKNKTYEPHVSMFVTDAFSKEIANMGLFQVNRPDSDAYLEGTIKMIRVIPYAVNKLGYTNEKRIDMTLELSLFRKNGTLIKRWNLTDYETYTAEYVNYQEASKQDAMRKLSERLARRFASALIVEY